MKFERISGINVASGNIVPITCKPPIFSSSGSHWDEIVVEQHCLPAFESPELCLQQHSISIMLGQTYQIDWRLAGGRLHSTQMRKGEIGITPKGVPTQARWHQDVEFLLLSLSSRLLKRVADEMLIGSDRIEIIPQRGIPDPHIFHLGMALKAELEAGCLSGKLYGESVATALTVHLLKRYSVSHNIIPEAENNLSLRQLQLVIDYIHDNIELDLTLTELAALIQMNSYSFCRWFKCLSGLSPHQYVIKCRIERAKFLLNYTQLPIIEIALRVGCSSQSNFTTLFRKQVGITPKEYRKIK